MAQADYVFFLAHAGPDTEQAKELRNLLEPGVHVFLDASELASGDSWDVELPKRQRRSLATVALLSRNTKLAYYLREEVATAIAFARHDPGGHRLIPVYLDGIPSDPAEIPYGVRLLHALDAKKLGMKGVAAELASIAKSLSGALPPPLPPELPKPADRFALYDAMCVLNESQFEELMFRAEAPKAHLAPATMTLSQRALNLIQWAEGQGESKMQVLIDATRRLAPGAFP